VAVALTDLFELGDDHLEQELLAGEDRLETRDEVGQLPVLGRELLALEAGETGQAHPEDGPRLPLAQVVLAARLRPLDLFVGSPSASDELLEARERQPHEPAPGFVRVLRVADGRDDEIDLRDGHPETLDQLALRERLAQLVAGAAGDDLAAVADELLEALLE